MKLKILPKSDRITLEPEQIVIDPDGNDFIIMAPMWEYDGHLFYYPPENIEYTFKGAQQVGIIKPFHPNTQEPKMAANLIEITIQGQTLVVPAGTSVEQALTMVKEAEDAGTMDVPLEQWDYINTLYDITGKLDYTLHLDIGSLPAITVLEPGPEPKAVFVCESTVELHKWLRKETTKQDSNGSK